MAQTKILVDTNAYFRLAQNIHPLLCESFGSADYTLYIHADLNSELRGVSRIKCKLEWVAETKYHDNRKRSINLSAQIKKDIQANYDYMWAHSLEEFHKPNGKGPGETDTLIIASALALDIYVITDDQDMMQIATDFEVKQMTSLQLMKLMLDEDHINMEKVEQVVEQWQYDDDTPHKNWKAEYKSLFGKAAPKFIE